MATRQEQVLIHLYNYLGRSDDYYAPYEVSQDGIAEALGIGRNYANIIVHKIEDAKLIYPERRRSKKPEQRIPHMRLCYKLEPEGIRKAQRLLEKGAA